VVHAVVELEVADREVRVIDVMVEGVQLGLVDRAVLGDLDIEAFERLEVALLVGVVERLSEVEILEVAGHVGGGGSQAYPLGCVVRPAPGPDGHFYRCRLDLLRSRSEVADIEAHGGR